MSPICASGVIIEFTSLSFSAPLNFNHGRLAIPNGSCASHIGQFAVPQVSILARDFSRDMSQQDPKQLAPDVTEDKNLD
jgi:hypothetical protein